MTTSTVPVDPYACIPAISDSPPLLAHTARTHTHTRINVYKTAAAVSGSRRVVRYIPPANAPFTLCVCGYTRMGQDVFQRSLPSWRFTRAAKASRNLRQPSPQLPSKYDFFKSIIEKHYIFCVV
jgi:hypothetical protein